jgi:hypothetical protein
MKKISLLLFPALTVAAFFVACGDDDSRSTCFKQTNWATNRCAKPTKNENDD